MNAFLIKMATTQDGISWDWEEVGVVFGATYDLVLDSAETYIENQKLVFADRNELQWVKFNYKPIKVL